MTGTPDSSSAFTSRYTVRRLMLKRSAISWAVTFFLLCRCVKIACNRSMRFTGFLHFIWSGRGHGQRFDPGFVFFEQVDELVDGDGAVYAPLHDILAFVKGDLTGAAAYIAEIRVRHFAGAVDDATHDGYLDPFEVVGHGPDTRGRFLQIEERAAA